MTTTDRLTTTATVLIHFRVIDDEPFSFKPGQFVAIDHDHPILGYRRSPYCLYGASASDRTFTLLVRVVEEGPVSLFLNELVPGDVISFRGPSGHSMIPRESDTHLMMLATGVGLGPCRCMIRHLAEFDPTRRVSLFWGLRLEEDICLEDELDALASNLPNFDWMISLSQPSAAWSGKAGRLTVTVPPVIEYLQDKAFYLVSNGEMVAEMSGALRELGVANSRIYEESFFNHRHKPKPDEIRELAGRFMANDLLSSLTDLDTAIRRRSTG